MSRRILWPLFLPLFGAAPDSRFLLEDPAAAHRVDYLILAAEPFVDRLDELAAHREAQGYAVGIVSMAGVRKSFESIRTFLAHAAENWAKPAPSFLLLVGDADGVPAEIRESSYREFRSEERLATDFDYACPLREGEPLLHVGRFPCDTPEELQAMVRKTIRYEKESASGAWQKRVALVAGTAGFSEKIDAVIEKQFRAVVSRMIPPEYDLEVAYASPDSPWCPYPPRFNENALRMLNQGALFYVFVGHGRRHGVDSIRWEGERHPILDQEHAEQIDAGEGLPIMIVLACSTGEFDAPFDCVGEVYFKRDRGPTAFLGGSRVTQPYGNGILGKALVEESFGDARTLGEIVTRAKMRVLRHERDNLTRQADLIAAAVQGNEALEPIRRDTVRHYNLFGDPALMVRRPEKSIRLTLEGDLLTVEAPVEEVELTLEVPRAEFARAIERELGGINGDRERLFEERYQRANDKAVKRWKLKLDGGRADMKVEWPDRKGEFIFKAHAGGRVGSLEVKRRS